jgi:hypothetical protein
MNKEKIIHILNGAQNAMNIVNTKDRMRLYQRSMRQKASFQFMIKKKQSVKEFSNRVSVITANLQGLTLIKMQQTAPFLQWCHADNTLDIDNC